MMRTLIRFTKPEYVNSILAGKLYMSSLSKFWNISNKFEEQKDIFEGTALFVETDKTSFSNEMKKVLSKYVRYRIEAYKYCNLLCFYSVDFDEETGTIQLPNKEMQDFGDACLVIKDTDAFIRKIEHTIPGLYICGSVEYHHAEDERLYTHNSVTSVSDGDTGLFDLKNLPCGNSSYGCLDKYDKYASQKEWRICYLADELNCDDKTIDVGDLSDVIEVVPSEIISEYLIAKYSPRNFGEIHNNDFSIAGNVGYSKFKNKIENIDGKCRMILDILG